MDFFGLIFDKILSKGYLGIFLATMLEYACFPISSEILFPFIGYCASRGGLSITVSLAVSTAGAITGCSICYSLGRFGQKFLQKYAYKRIPKLRLALDNASKWFCEKGSASVMIGRIFPLIRTYISFPAGMAKMNYFTFIIYTAIGAALWNTVLISSGYYLGEHWDRAGEIVKSPLFTGMVTVLIIVIVLWKLRKKKNEKKN